MTPAAIALLALSFLGSTADVSRLRPPPSPRELLGMQVGAPLDAWQYALGVTASYVRNPVVWRYPDGTYDPVVTSQVLLDLGLAIGLGKGFDVGVVLPIAASQRGEETSLTGLPTDRLSMSGAGLGDVRLVPRLAITRMAKTGVDLAVAAEVTFPTGDAERFRGETSLTVTPRLIASVPLALFGRDFIPTMSAGVLLRPRAEIADVSLHHELDVRGGVSLLATKNVTLLGELDAVTSAKSPFGEGGVTAGEARGGVRFGVGAALVTLGAGAGLSRGLGSPEYRVFLGLGYAPEVKDSDHDGIPDLIDDCPEDPEDLDGDRDHDGCPDQEPEELEEDYEYHVADCPSIPSGVPTIMGQDGCPLADTDGDGVPDILDKCPTEKETINGIEDEDGCPDEGEGKTIYLPKDRIEIKASILFETGKAAIKPESMPILDEVALQMLAHQEIKKVRVEGHTDSIGPDAFNLHLSQDRADAVRRYIIKKGVAKERIVAQGFGESRPIASNATLQGRAKNRRVDFVITE